MPRCSHWPAGKQLATLPPPMALRAAEPLRIPVTLRAELPRDRVPPWVALPRMSVIPRAVPLRIPTALRVVLPRTATHPTEPPQMPATHPAELLRMPATLRAEPAALPPLTVKPARFPGQRSIQTQPRVDAPPSPMGRRSIQVQPRMDKPAVRGTVPATDAISAVPGRPTANPSLPAAGKTNQAGASNQA